MEQSSLYFRCTLTPTQYQAAMAAPAARPREFDDWQQWLERSIGAGEFSEQDLDSGGRGALGEWLEVWTQDTPGSLLQYDAAQGVWQFALLEFTDNYGEMLQLLAPLRRAAQYADPEADSFVLIYSYLWGDGDDAFITLDQQRSQFAEAPSAQQRAEADAVLGGLMHTVQQMYD